MRILLAQYSGRAFQIVCSPEVLLIASQIENSGYYILPDVVSDDVVAEVAGELNSFHSSELTHNGQSYAARNLMASELVRQLVNAPNVISIANVVLGDGAFPVRALLFDKVPGANWNLGWHQDCVIPVAERRDVPGFSAWSRKRGVPHVRPPAAILEGMVALRIHLDDCGKDNGALRVIPGSHRQGILSEVEIKAFVERGESVVCTASRGSVLAMRPLLIHCSSPAKSPRHRRVIHIEYAACSLPSGLEWASWS
jgi:ectoine hydroxylase-related dioxygenase (phytanoyl-CoA dioxygenase family)